MSKPLKEIEALLQKEVDRKEFLRLMGAAILGVVGVTGLVHNLAKLGGGSGSASTQKQSSNKAAGYGRSAYGR